MKNYRHKPVLITVALILGLAVIEFAVTRVLHILYIPSLMTSFVDSILLITFAYPLIYYFVFRSLSAEISEHTRMEEELRKSHEKLIQQERLAVLGQVAASISHQLRTPLTGIKNSIYYLRLLGIDKKDFNITTHMSLIEMEVEACVRVLNNMMDFVIPRMPIRKEIHLYSVIDNTLSSMVIPTNIRVIKNYHERLPILKLDYFQIRQAFDNIMSNSIEAMAGKGDLEVSASVNGSHAVVSFKDTGIGILPENLGKIFEPLFSTTPTGVGLGLTVTNQIIEAHGGMIDVISEIGKGSIFKVKLPLG